MAKIILDGFDSRTEQDLADVLAGQGHRISIGWKTAPDSAAALFCSADNPAYSTLVREIRAIRPDLPVIAVTVLPEQAKWLDALEAGAVDYCCSPFETAQLSRLLAGVLGHPPKPSAASNV